MRVPSQVCCGKVALQRARFRVGACTDRLLSPCHLCRLFFHVNVWFDGPWRRHNFKQRQQHKDAMAARTKRPNKRAFWTLPCGTIWQPFFLCTRLPEDLQKQSQTQKVIAFSNGRTIQWAFRSDRQDAVLGSFWQVRTHAMM